MIPLAPPVSCKVCILERTRLVLTAGWRPCRAEDQMRQEAILRAGRTDEHGLSARTPPLAREGDERYVVAGTGALVTLADAKSRLYHFCSKLPVDK